VTRAEHWNAVYERNSETSVSWFQSTARMSLALIDACACPSDAGIVDVGAGASTLVDGLLERGYRDITLLDIAELALAATRQRLGAVRVEYVAADITSWRPARTFDLWHDRAVFHFLTAANDRAAYRATLRRALAPGAHVIIGTFADDGPERCCGLPVQRYSVDALAAEFAELLRPCESRRQEHVTPGGKTQAFTFVRFVKNH
jgi:SAM-dependent methyltransferase